MQTLIQTLEQVVAEVGENYVYPSDRPENPTCWYVWNGQPDCIAGRALFQLGVPIEVLSQYEGKSADDIPADLDRHATYALVQAQSWSDTRTPWGDVLAWTKRDHLNNNS